MPPGRTIIIDLVPQVDGIDPPGDLLTEVRSDTYLLGGRMGQKGPGRPRSKSGK